LRPCAVGYSPSTQARGALLRDAPHRSRQEPCRENREVPEGRGQRRPSESPLTGASGRSERRGRIACGMPRPGDARDALILAGRSLERGSESHELRAARLAVYRTCRFGSHRSCRFALIQEAAFGAVAPNRATAVSAQPVLPAARRYPSRCQATDMPRLCPRATSREVSGNRFPLPNLVSILSAFVRGTPPIRLADYGEQAARATGLCPRMTAPGRPCPPELAKASSALGGPRADLSAVGQREVVV
jgi:hypothetical protein